MLKRVIFNSSLFLGAFLCLFLVGEVTLRSYHFVKKVFAGTPVNQRENSPLHIDTVLGWESTPHFSSEHYEKDAGGNRYLVRYETAKDGFRIYGDVKSAKTKVLVIGDSFTQGRQVSNNDTYFSILQRDFPLEVFAYGGSGFGSLQQFFILDKHIDEIQPSLIIWQYCGNDFINNSFELESMSRINNNGMRRPYMSEDGQIFYSTPSAFSWLRDFVNERSRFLYFLFSRLDMLRAGLPRTNWVDSGHLESVEDAIEREGKHHPGFRKAAKITELIMKKVRQRAAGIRILAFSSDDASPYYEEFKRISRTVDIDFMAGIPEDLRAAQKEGIVVTAGDRAHWNPQGHVIVANRIREHLGKTYSSFIQP